jgi:hypothetical protein
MNWTPFRQAIVNDLRDVFGMELVSGCDESLLMAWHLAELSPRQVAQILGAIWSGQAPELRPLDSLEAVPCPPPRPGA